MAAPSPSPSEPSAPLELPRSARVASRLVVVASTGSTNSDLVGLAADASAWPHLAVLATDHQTAGRGRLGRAWQAPAGSSLAASVVLRPVGVPIEAYGWLPLLAGLAMVRAIRAIAPAGSAAGDAALKWPNDVLIEGRKVCGILAELLPEGTAVGGSPSPGRGVVVGAGVNVTMTRAELPVETATSLVLEGVGHPDADAVLAGYLEALRELVAALEAAAGDASAAGLPALVAAALDTLAREVRVELPSGRVLEGTASGLDELGRLLVQTDGERIAVAAGDVTHLRY